MLPQGCGVVGVGCTRVSSNSTTDATSCQNNCDLFLFPNDHSNLRTEDVTCNTVEKCLERHLIILYYASKAKSIRARTKESEHLVVRLGDFVEAVHVEELN